MSDFVREFLFGKSGIHRDAGGVRSEIAMDLRTEGWIGIPHGGISMGAVVDLFESLHEGHGGNQGLPYPITLNARMGGSRLRTGETVEIAVTPEGEGAKAIVSVQGSALPYLEADISKGPERSTPETVACLPSSLNRMEGALQALPYYRNCFVCGVDRLYPGMKRTFQFFDAAPQGGIVVSLVGLNAADRDTVHRFERSGRIHPIVLLALVDETLGWAGFMNYASGAVTVRMGATLHRSIDVADKLMVFARGEKVRGTGSRMFFWASGGAAVIGKAGAFEVVMTATGQFLGVPALTEQMRAELLPQDLTRRAFQIAESRACGR